MILLKEIDLNLYQDLIIIQVMFLLHPLMWVIVSYQDRGQSFPWGYVLCGWVWVMAKSIRKASL